MVKIVIVDDGTHYQHSLRLMRHFGRQNIKTDIMYCESEDFLFLQRSAEGKYVTEGHEGCPQIFVVKGAAVLWAASEPDAKLIVEAGRIALLA